MEKTITEKLRNFYKLCIIPAVLFFFITLIFQDKFKINTITFPKINLVFILSSLFFALVLPIIYRIINFYDVNFKGAMSEKRFISFEKMLIIISQISIYIMIIGNYVIESKIVMIVLSVVAFYSLYYYYPTSKKINLDSRIFMPKSRKSRGKR